MRPFHTLALCLAIVALPLSAQEAPPPAAPEAFDETTVPELGAALLALQIREGDIAIDRMTTMEMGGRFHTIHTKYMAMSCAGCHQGVEFPENAQFLRKGEFPVATQPGVVDRYSCISCHRGEGSIATQIYGVDPK
jgi:hypothetical protein